MSSSRRPWYPWYPKDFTSDEKVQCLPPLAELIYRRALDLMWQSNSIRIPNAMPLLMRSLGRGIAEADFIASWECIQYPDFELFKVTDDEKWLYSDRLRRESEYLADLSSKKRKAGITGANARWKNKEITDAKQTDSKRIASAKQTDSHTHTHTHIKDNPPTPHSGGNVEYSKSFDEWWSIYPNKVGKLAAYKSWQKIGKSKSASVSELTNSLKRQIESNHFRGTDGQDYIPKPATWLNQGRWMDEIKTGSSEPRRPRPPMFDPDNQYGDE